LPIVVVLPTPLTPTVRTVKGRRLASIYCAHCHKEDFGGGKFVEMPLATVDARNLTPGKGSATAG
jgi:hypothetical protein